MRRGTISAIVGAFAVVLAGAGYVVADVHDVIPGVLTLSEASRPASPPKMTEISAFSVTTAGRTSGDAPSEQEIRAAWAPVKEAAREGQWSTWGTVIDLTSGTTLLNDGADDAHTPASITKILTAYTALTHLKPADRLATQVFRAGDDLYIRGEGDLLLGEGAGSDDVNGRAGVADLADQVRSALAGSSTALRVHWQTSPFAGADRLQAWVSQGVWDYEGAVGAYAIDAGRVAPGAHEFVDDPARDVAEILTHRLVERGIEARLGEGRDLPQGAQEIANVRSATVGEQVRWMLHHSDNTLAEQYCRLAARAAGAEPSFSGATQNIVATLNSAGISTQGLSLDDCSGLSLNDRIPGSVIASTLKDSARADTQPAARRDLIRDLPWGGLQGTLRTRLDVDEAAGNAQAKTGSLASVSSLAGVVSTSTGRDLIFVVGNDRVPEDGAYGTRAVLDAFVQRLANL